MNIGRRALLRGAAAAAGTAPALALKNLLATHAAGKVAIPTAEAMAKQSGVGADPGRNSLFFSQPEQFESYWEFFSQSYDGIQQLESNDMDIELLALRSMSLQAKWRRQRERTRERTKRIARERFLQRILAGGFQYWP